MKKVKVVDSEPGYIPEDTRKKFKLGEYTEEKKLIQYISYYVFDFESEAILVEDGDKQSAAYSLYADIAKPLEYDDKWALDIALDCIRTISATACM